MGAQLKTIAAKHNSFVSGLITIYVILVFTCVSLGAVAKYQRSAIIDHVPVSTADVSVDVKESGENLYSFTSKLAYVSNGQSYFEVTIAGGTVLLDADTYSMYFSDGAKVKTNIYTFVATNEQSYMRKAGASSVYTNTRLSILGEEPFTEEETEELTKRACEVLTAEKYNALGDKNVTMPELAANEKLGTIDTKGLF